MKNVYTKNSEWPEFIVCIIAVLAVLSLPAAWLTHVVVCLSAASWGFLIAGAIFFPIGIIHGYGLWFGFF